MIVNAFADGDRQILRNLLSSEVYEGFDEAIRQREQRGERLESHFVSIESADVIGAEMRGLVAQLTLRFRSQLVSATRDKDGNVIDGSADKVSEATDVWTFARDVSSRDPNWRLIATEAAQ
jgi:predicted lipid-binding transport protein (Tim44 family)